MADRNHFVTYHNLTPNALLQFTIYEHYFKYAVIFIYHFCLSYLYFSDDRNVMDMCWLMFQIFC